MFGKTFTGYKQSYKQSGSQYTGYTGSFKSYQKSFVVPNKAFIHNLHNGGGVTLP